MCICKSDDDSKTVLGEGAVVAAPPAVVATPRSLLSQIMRRRYNKPARINLNLHWDEFEAMARPKTAPAESFQQPNAQED